MSARTSRPRVQSIESTATSQTGVGAALLAAIAVASTVKLLGAATRKALQSVAPALPQDALKTIRPLAEVRQARQKVQPTVPALPAVEAAKVAALAPLAASTYRVTDEAQLQQHLTSLCQAASVTDVQRIQGQLTAMLEAEHQTVLSNSLRVACANAAVKTGFTNIESMPGPAGTVRLVATNAAGQSLVTEISSDQAGNTSLETEVVGVSDGSCNGLLDAFDKALEAEGVRSAPPRRSFTGGVCELAAAREFVRNKLARPTTQVVPPTASRPNESTRRSQRLNRPQTGRQRT